LPYAVAGIKNFAGVNVVVKISVHAVTYSPHFG